MGSRCYTTIVKFLRKEGKKTVEVILHSFRFPLKAVKVMHTVSMRTEATIAGSEMPSNLGQVFKVSNYVFIFIFIIKL